MFEQFPYADVHQLNLDWIIQEIKKYKEFFDNQLDPLIEEKVKEISINMTISYEPSTETLILRMGDENNG